MNRQERRRRGILRKDPKAKRLGQDAMMDAVKMLVEEVST